MSQVFESAGTKKKGHDPLYIVGVGRSGTSLLQSMLTSHSAYAFPPEMAFTRRFIIDDDLDAALQQDGLGSAQSLLEKDERFQRCGLNVADVVAETKRKGQVTAAEIYRALLSIYARESCKPGFGDKDPRSVEFLPVISDVLPGVHLIHVIRDPRDILASKKKADWAQGHGCVRHIFANRVQLRIGRIEGRHLPAGHYHEVVYEQLLAEPESVLDRLCAELGIAYEPDMLAFGDSAKRLVASDEMSWKKETLGPLLAGNTGNWDGALSDWEVALTELVCRDHFAVGGHQRSGRIRRLSLQQRLSVYGAAALIMLLDPIYRLYRKWTVIRARKRLT